MDFYYLLILFGLIYLLVIRPIRYFFKGLRGELDDKK